MMSLTSALNPRDDINHWARNIENEWMVTDKLQLGTFDYTNGSTKACSAMNFGIGDFVDIGFSFDIVERPSREIRNQSTYDIHCSLLHMLQLYKASDVPFVCIFFHVRKYNSIFLSCITLRMATFRPSDHTLLLNLRICRLTRI